MNNILIDGLVQPYGKGQAVLVLPSEWITAREMELSNRAGTALGDVLPICQLCAGFTSMQMYRPAPPPVIAAD
jgi:hypothetical protein